MEDQIRALEEALAAEKTRRIELEEENDYLLTANARLQSEVSQFRQAESVRRGQGASSSAMILTSTAAAAAVEKGEDVDEVMLVGDGMFAKRESLRIAEACSGTNVLSVCFAKAKLAQPAAGGAGGEDGKECEEQDVIACGGVDANVHIYESSSGFKLASFKMSAPVLALDSCASNEYLLACSMMDGSHAVINLESFVGNGGAAEDSEHADAASSSSSSSSPVAHFKDHNKYVVGIKWSPDGSLLATCAHDKSVCLYKREEAPVLEGGAAAAAGAVIMTKLTKIMLEVTPESVVFVPAPPTSPSSSSSSSPSSSSSSPPPSEAVEAVAEKVGGHGGEKEWELVIATRERIHLTYLNCSTLVQRNVCLNENEWDTHASFNPLFLSLSPDQRLTLVATDKNLHFITKVGSSKRTRLLAGHNCSDYGKPKVSWDVSNKYVFSNSENDNAVIVYCLATQTIVGRLEGHRGIVRDVCCHRTKRQTLTASYDHSVILWSS